MTPPIIETLIREIISGISGLGADTLVVGTRAKQNVTLDKHEDYPCVIVDSPKRGSLRILKTGAVEMTNKFDFFVLDSIDIDSEEWAALEIQAEMGGYALEIFAKLGTVFLQAEISAEFVELEGEFDANLAGWGVFCTVKRTVTDIPIC